MDKFFLGQKDSPNSQNFTKKDNVAQNSEADAKKATEILKADSKLGQTVQSIVVSRLPSSRWRSRERRRRTRTRLIQ